MRISLISPPWLAVSVLVAAAVVCAAVLAALLKTGLAWRLAVDVPNDRSLHKRPTPRVGGWGIVPVVTVGIVALAPSLWLVALCAVFLAAISQIDDRRGLPARVRFVAHLVAVVLVIAMYPPPAPVWTWPILVLLMVWLINLYNFMDGADGLAGGMAFFGFGTYGAAALMHPHPMLDAGLANVAIAGAALGFLVWNFNPARIFLGDAGSIPLGFLAGALGYWGWRSGAWPIWFPAMAFAPFIADASATLVRRLLRGEKFWQAHREHYYQRMVLSGIGHAATAWLCYCVMFVGAMVALYGLHDSARTQWALVTGWSAVLLLIGAAIDRRWHRFQLLRSRNNEVDADVSQ